MRLLICAGIDPKKSAPDSGVPITDELVAAYMKYNEDLHRAGVLVAAEGLSPAPNSRARVVVKGGKRTVVDGPFAETKELLGGIYLIDVESIDQAIEWALRCPVGLGFDEVLEIYRLTDLSDIPPEMLKVMTDAAPTWSASVLQSRRPPA